MKRMPGGEKRGGEGERRAGDGEKEGRGWRRGGRGAPRVEAEEETAGPVGRDGGEVPRRGQRPSKAMDMMRHLKNMREQELAGLASGTVADLVGIVEEQGLGRGYA